MAMVDLKSVYKVTAKGRTYWYAWKGKGAPRLHSEPGTPAFVEELAVALAERRGGDPDKVSGLVIRYRGSDEYKALAASTRRNWARWLDRIQAHFGALSIRQFDRPSIRLDIRRWRDRHKATPRTADYGMQVLSRLLSYAVAEGKLGTNPCFGIPNIYRGDRSELIWTDADTAAVFAVALARTGLGGQARHVHRPARGRPDQAQLEPRPRPGDRDAHRQEPAAQDGGDPGLRRAGGAAGGHPEARHHHPDQHPRPALAVGLRRFVARRGGPGRGRQPRAALPRLSAARRRPRCTLAGLSIREIAELLAWSEDRVERLIDRYVKRDELLRDRIRRLETRAASNGSGTDSEKPSEKPASA
jgi:hypothetical protein